MLRRSVYLLAGFVFQGVVLTVWLVHRGAGLTVSLVAFGVDRTVDLVSWGVDRTTGLAWGARGTLVRLWDAAGVEQLAAVALELPEITWGFFRTYLERLGSAARCRTQYQRMARQLRSRYRELRRGR